MSILRKRSKWKGENVVNDKDFIAYMFCVLLKEYFGTKRAMARALDIPFRTLQENFQDLDYAKGGTIAFERLFFTASITR